MTTDMCVSTTARVGANLGYRTTVVGDATAAFDLVDIEGRTLAARDIERAHLATLNAEFADVVTTDAVVAALAATTRAVA
jgi:nicotinamidase-related amidase